MSKVSKTPKELALEDDYPFELSEVTELLGQPLMLSQLQMKEPQPPLGTKTDATEE